MKVRIREGVGVYRLNGVNHTRSMGEFEISENDLRAYDLLGRGIVDVVEENAPTVEKPLKRAPRPQESAPSPVLVPEEMKTEAETVNFEDLTLVQLREECVKRGLQFTAHTRKASLIELLKNAQ